MITDDLATVDPDAGLNQLHPLVLSVFTLFLPH